MTNFKRMAPKMNISTGHFNVFMDKVLNPKDKRKRLFDLYDAVLHKVEIAHADFEAAVLRHIGKPDFKPRILKHGQRINRLEREAVSRLKNTLTVTKQDIGRSQPTLTSVNGNARFPKKWNAWAIRGFSQGHGRVKKAQILIEGGRTLTVAFKKIILEIEILDRLVLKRLARQAPI